MTRTLLPRIPAAILRALLPLAEREEVLAELGGEFAARRQAHGESDARRWLWAQTLGSVPALVGRTWWRGWSGFEPHANRMRPGGPMLESWIMDLRYAARRLRTRPRYATLAVLTLALGVGGGAAIFGIVRGLLLEPLPYRAEEEIGFWWYDGSWNTSAFFHLQPEGTKGVPGFRQIAAYRPEDVTLQSSGGPTRLLPGIAVSHQLFDVLGARPMLGAGFQPGDDRPGAEPKAVISHSTWQELGGDRGIVGTRLRLDGVDRTVVGVMPRGFWFPDPGVRVWTADPLNPQGQSGRYTFIGRTAPGTDLAHLEAPLAAISKSLNDRFDYPEQWDPTKNPSVKPVREALVGGLRPALLATLAAMGLILLIAGANVAALMLGQVEGRTSELAVRSALGADRGRLTQQLVFEALLVGLLAGIVGALIGAGGFKLLVGALPLGTWAEQARPDWALFAAAMALALVLSVAIAFFPVWQLWRGDLRAALGRARAGGIAGRGGRLESGLVVAEVALAVLLAAGVGLLVRSEKLYAIDPGVDTRGVAMVEIAMSADLTGAPRRQALRTLQTELAALPGVKVVGAAQRAPLRGGGDNWGFQVEGQDQNDGATTAFRIVTPGYFEALGIAVRRGRTFDGSDRPEGERSVVINEAMAKKHFGGQEPIGRRISTGFEGWERIVGVVENVAEETLTNEFGPARYMLMEQLPYTPEGWTFVIRTTRPEDAVAILDAARRTVQRVVPGAAVQEATTMQEVFARAVGPVRQLVTLLGLLTALALALGAVGVYGVISHFVTRRNRDWGIRMALGLAPSRVLTKVISHGTLLVAMGIVVGIMGVIALRKVLASFLYGIGGTDPVAIAGATMVLLLVGVLSALLPARRASRTDPALVLREQ